MSVSAVWKEGFRMNTVDASSPRGMSPVKKLVIIALLVALSVVLERLLGYNGKVLNISFGYLPIALAGMLLGPVPGALAGALGDFLGAMLFPVGPINPFFILVAAVQGALYGLFLHQPFFSKWRLILCQLIITVVLHIVVNTFILVPIVGKSFLALMPARALKNFLFFPVEVFTLIKMQEYRGAMEGLIK